MRLFQSKSLIPGTLILLLALGVVLLAALPAAGPAMAQPSQAAHGSGPRFGIIDAQEVVQKTKRGQAVQRRLEGMQKQKQAQLVTAQDAIKKLEKEVLAPSLDAKTRESKSRQLQQQRTTLKQSYEDAQGDIQRETQKALLQLEKDVMPMIQQVGRNKGYKLIFDKASAGIAYFDGSIDITRDLIKAVDARYPN